MNRFQLGLALALGAGPAVAQAPACDPETVTLMAEAGPRLFHVEIADEPDEQARGLMFRSAMPAESGMLFVFEPPRPASFWMRNTMIPLDMLFIDASGRVETIAERRDTYSLQTSRSDGPVRAVLEINGGLSRELGIGPGTQAVHPAFTEAPEPFRCGG